MNKHIGWSLALLVISWPLMGQTTRPSTSTTTTATTTTAPTTTVSTEQIDLLEVIKPRLDALSGQWSLRGGVLHCSGDGEARLQLPYEPAEEYDYEIHFVRERGDNCVIQILSHDNMPFIWVMGTGGKKGFTFHYLKGAGDFENRTTRDYTAMVDGREYVSVVKVRRDGVKAYLDGELVSSWETDYTDVERRPWWRLQNDAALGLASAGVATEFRAIRVTEVSGKGKLLRAPMPLPFRTANQSLDDPKKWTIKLNSMHTMSDGHLRCEGNASISFNEDIPAECRISFDLNIMSGPSPRIYFDGSGICIANQARSQAITVQDATSITKPVKNLKGKPISYKPGDVLHCAIEFRGGHFELTAGDQMISADCHGPATLRLALRGSTGDSKSATDISALRIEPLSNSAAPAQ